MFYLEFVVVVLLGLSFGSFANVCILRSFTNESFGGRSHCPKCNTQIAAYDLIPILSFFILKGKCRYCKSRISIQYPIVEAICAITWAVIYLHTGIGAEFLLYASFSFFTLMIVVTDFLENDVYVWMILFCLLIVVPLQIYIGQGMVALWGGMTGAGMAAFTLLVAYVIKKYRGYKEVDVFALFGLGDVLFMILLGTVCGPLGTFSVIYGAFMICWIIGYLSSQPGKRKEKMLPLCPSFGIALICNVYLPGGFLGTFWRLSDLIASYFRG